MVFSVEFGCAAVLTAELDWPRECVSRDHLLAHSTRAVGPHVFSRDSSGPGSCAHVQVML